jgi:dTDP-4-amino-4,6-dideoxygalactose transaminase
MIKFLDLQKNYSQIKNEVDESIMKNLWETQYINCVDKQMFEKEFAEYIGTKYCIGVANGTDALEIGISSLELNDGDEIITQPNSYIATCLGISYNNIKPIFVDINETTLMIDCEKIEEKITEKTKALCIVHLYGCVPNMDKIMEIVKKYNLYLIEDCAQSHGAKYNDIKMGTFGDIACFSFYPGKNLGCYGDGGAICTNNEKIYQKIKLIHNIGSNVKYYHEVKGRNSRLDNIQAGILRIKLKYLDQNNLKRQNNANQYILNLINCSNIILPQIFTNTTPVWHLFVVRVLNNKRVELQQYLKDNNIETLIHYPIPIHKQKAYIECNSQIYPICEKTSEQILSLPMYPELTFNEINYICMKIKEYFQMNQ